jgi:putative exporter of polyketide antibiotics
MGDMIPNAEILSLINPLGLINRAEFFWKQYLPKVILAVLAVILIVIAYKLNSIRDIDQGIIP